MVKEKPQGIPAVESLIGKYEIAENGCWIWTAGRDKHGYGQIALKGWPFKAHRVSYTHLVGPIPEGLVIDHLCRNPPCINPEHLEPVTQAENMRRTKKDVCPEGHDRAVYSRIRKNGGRQCGECARQRSLEWYYRTKAKGIDPNAKRRERRAG